MIHERRHCRTCGSARLEPILDLGSTALANNFVSAAEVAGYRTCLPLRLRLCVDCSLAQLADVVDPGVLYSRYAYVTSTSRTMDAHLAAQAGQVLAQLGLPAGKPARVLEIASNTGIYLQKFKALGCEVLGVEHARNIAELAEHAGVPTWTDFFSAHSARQIRDEWGRPDVILGRHVFAHIDDLRDLVAALDTLGSELPKLVRGLRSQGRRVIGYGASAKGNTLLNTSGLKAGDLDYIIDNTPFKQGKLAPGSWIPVRPPEALLVDQPDYALLLAWNFAPEIIARERRYQERGGRFILPIPEPRIVQFAQ
ncbi:MAG: class I SAM-dependent methyltransferase [Betaproteobacteria bacterium]